MTRDIPTQAPRPQVPKRRDRNTAIVAAKLLACGASIAAIAWAVGILGPDGSVDPSQADIGWFNLRPASQSALFAQSLEALGHDAPQAFELNGNVVYLSTRTSDKSPRELLGEYQEEFVRRGLNHRAWREIPDNTEELLVDAMTGNVVPVEMSETRIVLAAMITQNRARTPEQLADLARQQAQSGQSLLDTFRGHRHIEISRDPGERHSSVVSSWSEDTFDYRRMLPSHRRDEGELDPEVPACPACTSVQRFRDLDPVRHHRSQMFTSPSDVASVAAFYRQALTLRGWESTESLEQVPEVRRLADPGHDPLAPGTETAQFVRDGEFLTLLVYPDEPTGKTVAMVVRGL